MKVIVYYQSKTGFTKTYAEWIAASLGCDHVELSRATVKGAAAYDVVIYGGGLYAGGIHGLRFFFRNPFLKPDTRVVVFATGVTPVRTESTTYVRNVNLSKKQQSTIPLFYLRGGFDFTKLGWIDKILMSLLKVKIMLKPSKWRVPDEKGMLAAYAAPSDFTKHKYIDDLVEYVKNLNSHS